MTSFQTPQKSEDGILRPCWCLSQRVRENVAAFIPTPNDGRRNALKHLKVIRYTEALRCGQQAIALWSDGAGETNRPVRSRAPGLPEGSSGALQTRHCAVCYKRQKGHTLIQVASTSSYWTVASELTLGQAQTVLYC